MRAPAAPIAEANLHPLPSPPSDRNPSPPETAPPPDAIGLLRGLCFFAGGAIVAVGIGLLSIPYALVFLGAFLIVSAVFAELMEYRRR